MGTAGSYGRRIKALSAMLIGQKPLLKLEETWAVPIQPNLTIALLEQARDVER